VRSLHLYAAGRPPRHRGLPENDHPLVVVLPGLGFPRYTVPAAQAVARRGAECAVLDLPGFGWPGPRTTRPDIHAIGLLTAQWLDVVAGGRPVVLLGHSTGAQAALTGAVTAYDGGRRRLALVMAGPTFAPRHRRVVPLLLATPKAYRNDSVGEIHPSEVLRGRGDIVTMLRSALLDAPEGRVGRLRTPLTLTSGVHDSYAPAEWLDELAAASVAVTHRRVVQLGGSHNNLSTHPDDVAEVVAGAVGDADAATAEGFPAGS